MSLAVLNTYTQEVAPSSALFDIQRRRCIIRRKVLAVGRMSRNFTVLREHPELVQKLKSYSSNGKLPVGILARGEHGLRQAIALEESKVSGSKLAPFAVTMEQKDRVSHTLSATPNSKVAREGHM